MIRNNFSWKREQLFSASESGSFMICSAIVFSLLLSIVSFTLTISNTISSKVSNQASADLAVLSASAHYKYLLRQNVDNVSATQTAESTANLIFAQNDKHGLSMNFAVLNNRDFRITLANVQDTVLYHEDSGPENINYNVEAISNTREEEFSVHVIANYIVEAIRNSQSITTLLQGVDITALYTPQGGTEGRYLLSDANGELFDGTCKNGDFIGFIILNDVSRCHFFQSNDRRHLEIGLSNLEFVADEFIIQVSDIHSSGYTLASPEGLTVTLHRDDDSVISEFIVNAYGIVSDNDANVLVTGQPLDDNYQPTPFNHDHDTINHSLGIMEIKAEITSDEQLAYVTVQSTFMSFVFASFYASKSTEGPVKLVQ